MRRKRIAHFPLSSPESPFNDTPSSTVANNPVNAPPADPSSGPPAQRPIDPNDPDAITAITDDGRIIQDRPDGQGGREIVEGPYTPPTASSGATQLEVREENLNAGQKNNPSNTKNRTGSDDGKKDKDKQPSSSGSGSSNNHSSGCNCGGHTR